MKNKAIYQPYKELFWTIIFELGFFTGKFSKSMGSSKWMDSTTFRPNSPK